MRISRTWTSAPLLVFLLAANPARADLTHRWSFNDSFTSTNAVDSVGGASGNLFPGASYPGDGTVALDGASGYVEFPPNLVSNYNSITYEAWFTDTGSGTWARVWDFGNNNGSTGTSYMYLSPVNGGGNIQTAYNEGSGEQVFTAGPRPLQYVEHHVVFTQDAATHTAIVYLDGQRVGQNVNFTFTPAGVGATANDWLGHSQYSGDARFAGSIDEFRLWNNALTPQAVEASYESGPNTVSTNAGALQSIALQIPGSTFLGSVLTPVLMGTYASLTNQVNLSLVPGISYQSSDTNVLSLGADGNFHALTTGTATIQASYAGLNSSVVVTVSEEQLTLMHRYSFSETSGSTVADSVGGADGTIMFYGVLGNGMLSLNGNTGGGYVALPSGLIHTMTNATFEAWVNWNGGAAWQRIFDFGNNPNGAGADYTTLTPKSGPNTLRYAINIGGEQDVDAPTLTVSNEVCVTVSYDATAHSAKIFVNGRLVGSGTLTEPLSGVVDNNCWLGASQFSADPFFDGSYDEFRIYEGAMSALQAAIDTATGPNTIVTNPGALQSVSVTTSNSVDIRAMAVPIQVTAKFANVSGVDVSTLAQTVIASSDTSVATVVNGNLVAQNPGVTTISATYGGLSGSMVVTVVDTNAWPSLLHRYTFNDAPGSTTLLDSVGSINGTVNGPATFNGSQLVMPAGNPAPVNGQPTASSGGVQFPAGQGLASSLPNEASFEIWVVWAGGGVWQEMFDFGQAATPGVSSGGGQYVMISPHDGATGSLRAEWDQNGATPAYDLVLTGPPLQSNVLSQVVWTHDQDRQIDKLYRNGVLVASAVNTGLWNTLPDTDNWMARDEWPDPMFNGAYSDFRIWNGALTPGQVANLYTAGPDVIPGPALKISMVGNQVMLAWPTNAVGFALQSSPSLAPATWTPYTGTPTVVNGLNTLTVGTSQSQVYYRLKQ